MSRHIHVIVVACVKENIEYYECVCVCVLFLVI